MFSRNRRYRSARHQDVWGTYERIYTVVDVAAGLCFVVGSWLFFYPDLQEPATWFFLVGSVLFVVKPSVRMLREFHLANLPLPGDDVKDG